LIFSDHCDYSQLTAEEIEDIRKIKLKDVLLATTDIEDKDIQDDVFTWNHGKLTYVLPLPVLYNLHNIKLEWFNCLLPLQ